jgi:hypothetical protein
MHHGASARLARSSIPAGRGKLAGASGSVATSTSNENTSATATTARKWIVKGGRAAGGSAEVRCPELRGAGIGERQRMVEFANLTINVYFWQDLLTYAVELTKRYTISSKRTLSMR